MKKSITIKLTISDAKTLEGLVDGCLGTSGDNDFNVFAHRVLKKIDKELKKLHNEQEVKESDTTNDK